MPIQKSNGFAGSSQSGRIAAHRGDRRRLEGRKLEAAIDHEVGGDDAERAAGGGDADAPAARLRQHDKRAQRVEKIIFVLGARRCRIGAARPSRILVVGASEPVCEADACAPSWVRPGLSTTIGLLLAHLARAFQKRARIADALDI